MIIKKKKEQVKPSKPLENKVIQQKNEVNDDGKIDLFDLDNIDFSQRQERRRGDRRRGYRRIDDRNLISRAQEEAGTIRENAAKEGYKEGLEHCQGDIQYLKNAIVNFMKAKDEVFEFIAPEILNISVEIAKKIVKKEIEQSPEIILETITDVLRTLPKEETRVTIKVNPEQSAYTKEHIPDILSSLGLTIRTNIVADGTIELGSCIVQTSNGVVDATISTQLEIIKEVFKVI